MMGERVFIQLLPRLQDAEFTPEVSCPKCSVLIHRPRIIRRAPGYSSLLQNESALFLEFGLVDLTLRETLLQNLQGA